MRQANPLPTQPPNIYSLVLREVVGAERGTGLNFFLPQPPFPSPPDRSKAESPALLAQLICGLGSFMLLGLSFELGNKKLPELHQSVFVEGPNPPLLLLPSPAELPHSPLQDRTKWVQTEEGKLCLGL